MPQDTATNLYASPVSVKGQEDCRFYHSIDLPELGPVTGDWDLRHCAAEYLGNVDFAGKRALDMGAASGFLSFEMEKRGADVVSFDMVSGRQWNFVPYPDFMADIDAQLDRLEAGATKIRNSYWLSHQLLKSKARAYYGDIYQPLPAELGQFDIAIFGMIFSHLRDPFGAMAAILPSVREKVIVTNTYLNNPQPIAAFIPSKENLAQQAFWVPTKTCVEKMLSVFGFQVVDMVDSKPLCTVPGHNDTDCTAIVAERIEG
ncbi:methyltransferase domain-containing protein [Pseudophaeobacter sp.]|uniref:class I SAM-dependent methyltransferase n=1 Tax=Pseudophaeobacter sp. TaxID=1971739 RepID=UPI00329988C3